MGGRSCFITSGAFGHGLRVQWTRWFCQQFSINIYVSRKNGLKELFGLGISIIPHTGDHSSPQSVQLISPMPLHITAALLQWFTIFLHSHNLSPQKLRNIEVKLDFQFWLDQLMSTFIRFIDTNYKKFIFVSYNRTNSVHSWIALAVRNFLFFSFFNPWGKGTIFSSSSINYLLMNANQVTSSKIILYWLGPTCWSKMRGTACELRDVQNWYGRVCMITFT